MRFGSFLVKPIASIIDVVTSSDANKNAAPGKCKLLSCDIKYENILVKIRGPIMLVKACEAPSAPCKRPCSDGETFEVK